MTGVLMKALIVGYPFAWLLNLIRPMGNPDNEGRIVWMQIWTMVFGVIVWVVVILGTIWAFNNLSISVERTSLLPVYTHV
jgi:hypothetical protein